MEKEFEVVESGLSPIQLRRLELDSYTGGGCSGYACGGNACGGNACGTDLCGLQLCPADVCGADACLIDFFVSPKKEEKLEKP